MPAAALAWLLALGLLAQPTGSAPEAAGTRREVVDWRVDLRGSLIAVDPDLSSGRTPGWFDAAAPRLSFDDLLVRDLAYEVAATGVLYATAPEVAHFRVEAALALWLGAGEPLELDDLGSVLRVQRDFGAARLALVAFPGTSDRVRLGFSNLVSATTSELMGQVAPGRDAPRAAQLELVADEGYVYVAASSATTYSDPEPRALWMLTAGAGATLVEGVSFEVQGAYGRNKTEFELEPARVVAEDFGPARGVAARLAFVDGIALRRPVDYAPLTRDLFVGDSLQPSAACADLCVSLEGTLLWLRLPHFDFSSLAAVSTWSGAFGFTARLATPRFEVQLVTAMREIGRLVPAVLPDLAEVQVHEQSELRVGAIVGSPLPEHGLAWRLWLGLVDPARLEPQDEGVGRTVVYFEGEVIVDPDEDRLILDGRLSLLGALAGHAVIAVEPYARRHPYPQPVFVLGEASSLSTLTVGVDVIARAFF